jgi:hypothetical protein
MRLRFFRTDSNSFRRGATALLISGLLAAPALASGNALSNGEFSGSTVSPWTPNMGFTLYWSNYDHATSVGSVRWTQPKSSLATSVFSEKVQFPGSQSFSAGGYFRTVGTAPAKASVQVQIRYFSDTSCSTWLSTQKSGFKTLSTSWVQVSMSLTSPAAARCAQMQVDTQELFVLGGQPSASYDILADGLYIGSPASLPAPVFTSSFDNFNGWTVVD